MVPTNVFSSKNRCRWFVCGKPLVSTILLVRTMQLGKRKAIVVSRYSTVRVGPLETRMDSLAMFTLLYPLFSFSTHALTPLLQLGLGVRFLK
jgi:hypothetical protein